MEDLYGTDATQETRPGFLAHADNTAPTRENELDYTDHTDQE